MASRGGNHSGLNDSFSDYGTRRHDNDKESTSHQYLNAKQPEYGRVLNKYSNRGGNSRSSLPGVIQEYRIVKDHRIKQEEASGTVPEVFNNGDTSNVGGKSSTEKVAALHSLVTGNGNEYGHGAVQVDTSIKSAARAHDKEASSVRKLEQSGGMQTTSVGSHAVLGKGIQNREVTVASGENSFSGELCCSSSDPIHVPSPGSKSAGTFGAIKREVGVVGGRQQSSDKPGTNTSTSNSFVKVVSALKDNHTNERQSGLPGSSLKNSCILVPLSNRPFPSSQYHHKPQKNICHTKAASAHLEWKPKSISPSSTNQEVSVSSSGAPLPVDGSQSEVAVLSKKLLQANVSGNEQVIIPEHIRVPESERTHLIFGTFESEVSKTSGTTSDTVATIEGLNDHSPSNLRAPYDIATTDIPSTDKMDHVVSQSSLPQSNSISSVSEHQQSSSEVVEVPSPCVVPEFVTEAIPSKVTHSQSQFQHLDNLVVPNFKTYEPDSRYEVPFIAKAIDEETAECITYPSEVMGLQPGNDNQILTVTQQPVPQMYPQQFQVPQSPMVFPYRHVYSQHSVPPMVVPSFSNNPAFPQLSNASNYLVMPNGTPPLATNGMKYGLSHQYKKVIPGTPAGYGGYANHNGYIVNTGVIGSTGHVDEVNMSKYKDNNLYTPNLQGETANMWVQDPREIPNMPPPAFYNVMGQPMSPHAAYLPSQNGHTAFTPAPLHPAHFQYPGIPHTLQPTSMAMMQNLQPSAMVHQAAVPQLAGNLGLDMATMAPGSLVGAFQQSQLGHICWAPPTY